MSRTKVVEILEITGGVILLTLGFYFFLLPQNLVIGGVMGISVLVQDFIPVSLFIMIANIVLLAMGLIFLGKTFFLKTVYATVLYPVIVFILEKTVAPDFFMQYINESPYLIAGLFGALTVGTGLGLVIRNNSTTGGIDILQNMMHKYLHIPFAWAIYIIDGAIITVALFIDFQAGLYAFGAMILSGMIIDRMSIEGRSGFTFFILTDKTALIKAAIYEKLDRGLTKIKVIGGYSNQEKEMIVCTIDRLQLYTFKLILKEIDPKAFTFVTRTKEASGYGFSKGSSQWKIEK
ncbi:YitT family protein [Mariniplasma anaerobium]|uniref:Membrane protein n=1 Tax=Mariniplasma anaerobium TaxID=2735436 RepID=A0A7U9THL7_9MOLU|nr:YitT family protein [Mariniplasma anaerobium]BCR36334.1 membrane protein [Mariniplasma anaerobium]